jgi:hypothetical protein
MMDIACYLCGSALPGYLASVLPPPPPGAEWGEGVGGSTDRQGHLTKDCYSIYCHSESLGLFTKINSIYCTLYTGKYVRYSRR